MSPGVAPGAKGFVFQLLGSSQLFSDEGRVVRFALVA
ncbi:MAG: hypothetical protein QOI57_2585, partial [Rubrobacteraceae bacterium]|nr:hypothetical protein [Rubrobacteraceae bacterium]